MHSYLIRGGMEGDMELTQKDKQKSKVRSYELVRLIATILVIIGHSSYIKQENVDYTNFAVADILTNTSFFHFQEILVVNIYEFHMQLFFMLSGAVFALAPTVKLGTLVKKKAKRLLVPYFLYGLLFMFPIKLISDNYNKQSIGKAVVSFFYSTENSGHLWFLPTLFFCFVIFRLFQIALDRMSINTPAFMIVSTFLLYCVRSLVDLEILSIGNVLTYLFWFTLGFFFENYRSVLTEYTNKQIGAITIVSFILSCDFFISSFLLDSVNLSTEIKTLFFSFNVYMISELFVRLFEEAMSNKLYKVVARNLFYIYLFHDPLEYLILKIFFNTEIFYCSGSVFLYYFCRIVLVIIISILLGEAIRKVKKCIVSKKKK